MFPDNLDILVWHYPHYSQLILTLSKGYCSNGSFQHPSNFFPTITWSFSRVEIYSIYDNMSYLPPFRLIKEELYSKSGCFHHDTWTYDITVHVCTNNDTGYVSISWLASFVVFISNNISTCSVCHWVTLICA